jgi:proline dehydrogenase
MSVVSFSNIKNAFAYKSNAELNKAYWLFKAISNNFLVNMGPKLTLLALKMHLPVKPLIRSTIYSHFCGGETIDECTKTIEQLGKYHVGSILDYSVEGHEKESDFDQSCIELQNTVKRAKGDKNIPFCVFKVTGVGRFELLGQVSEGRTLTDAEQQEWQRLKNRVMTICRLAYECKVRIFIDAEESWIQKAIDDLADEMMLLFNQEITYVYNTIQLYRHDRLLFLKQNIEWARSKGYKPGYKLVRGAYMEKERARAEKMQVTSPIQASKTETDHDYDAALKVCINNHDIVSICAGTHNEASSLLLTRLMEEKNISNKDSQIWFSQLLGMSDHISFNLAEAGYNVCKYVPYGPVVSVLPYLFRRAAENTSISGQMGRELRNIQEERERRKKDR